MKAKQPWLHTPLTDLVFVLGPPFFCFLAVLLFPAFFQNANNQVSVEAWVVLVLLIDVGHVYTTLFRTYFDPYAFNKHKQLFVYVPFLALIGSILLYSVAGIYFWRMLAYLAVFHFIRQQYGFMQLYSRLEKKQHLEHIIDKITIYSSTIYPILYWHLEGNREFNWFLDNDFFYYDWPAILPVLTGIYILILFTYIFKEIRFSFLQKQFNIPRNLVILGTALSWYFGIVYYNGDLTFTLFNVVSHGIPYMALIWFYGQKQQARKPINSTRLLSLTFKSAGIILFLVITFGFAFLEEGLWDAFVWKEHQQVFSIFHNLPALQDKFYLTFLIPLLALPQLTHYILDGFIWKVSTDKNLKGN